MDGSLHPSWPDSHSAGGGDSHHPLLPAGSHFPVPPGEGAAHLHAVNNAFSILSECFQLSAHTTLIAGLNISCLHSVVLHFLPLSYKWAWTRSTWLRLAQASCPSSTPSCLLSPCCGASSTRLTTPTSQLPPLPPPRPTSTWAPLRYNRQPLLRIKHSITIFNAIFTAK